MPHWMRLTGGGIGMHAGIIPNPGLPASHGCIRLPAPMAATLYQVVAPGSKVVITHDAPYSSPLLTAGAQ
jgi:lipoprotein-anchoring transpeptidase ErfK/SrfK